MLIVGTAFLVGHGVILQFLAGFAQARCCGVGGDDAVFQVAHPFVQRGDGYLVELIDPDEDVFWENLSGKPGYDGVLFLGADLQLVAGMYADKVVLPVIQVVAAYAQVEIEDADGVDLLYFPVGIAQVDAPYVGWGYAIVDAFNVMQQAFDGPVETDVTVLQLAHKCLALMGQR